jgi:hypothetical protein
MTREESVQDLYVDVQRRSVALKGFVKLLVRSGQALVWSGQVSQVRQASKQAGKGGGSYKMGFPSGGQSIT